nr:hypothetical protein [Tanacetum cinerariifolium]
MKEVFARYGYATDVFILMKRNSSGKKFGFCMFLEIKDHLAFDKVHNSICFGSQKCICYISKFQRPPTAPQSYHKPFETKTQLPNLCRKPSGTFNITSKPSYANTFRNSNHHTQPPPSNPRHPPLPPNNHHPPPPPPNPYLSFPTIPLNPPLSSIIYELKSFDGVAITQNNLLDQDFTNFSIKYLDSSEDNSDDIHGGRNNSNETGGEFIPETFSNAILFMESTVGQKHGESNSSNEVVHIVHLGNEIGFDMHDKDIVVTDVLAQGEFK